ncbi:glutathione synthetase ATP-binding domain-like protein [Xylaria sp. FL1777]|nr:glutathione synthetase ATP-binding domain-like protein [Xylaria sp. FL1777]
MTSTILRPTSFLNHYSKALFRPWFRYVGQRSMHNSPSFVAAMGKLCVAVLYQAIDAPIINGVKKPRKPGGYQDSGADIAYVLREKANVDVVTFVDSPDPQDPTGWCFPDHEDGILSAIEKGATRLWANTILFASHPLQTSSRLSQYEDEIRIIGQPPNLVETFDDKAILNDLLRKHQSLTLPYARTVSADQNPHVALEGLRDAFPLVAKPVRGRGSHGVKVCSTWDELQRHIEVLLKESPLVLVEEFLSGEEATVTVMPPSKAKPYYWSMPVVTRFNHEDNVAPYNGTVAVVANSRVISADEAAKDPEYAHIQRQCETVAELMKGTAPIRIDVRRFTPDAKSPFALFDVNLKPNMTGPGRPGRSDQASLTALAATGLGWDYPTLLKELLTSSHTLGHLRHIKAFGHLIENADHF